MEIKGLYLRVLVRLQDTFYQISHLTQRGSSSQAITNAGVRRLGVSDALGHNTQWSKQ
jgi:hypothetical protein